MIDFIKIQNALDAKFQPSITDESSNPSTFGMTEDELKLFFTLQTRTKLMIIEALKEYHQQFRNQ